MCCGCKVLVARSSLLREDWGQYGERDLRLRGYLFHFLHAAVYGPRIGRGRHFHAFFGHDIDEATDKSHTQHLIQYISYWWKGKVERRFWNIVPIDVQDAD